jgi:hypothetical protein
MRSAIFDTTLSCTRDGAYKPGARDQNYLTINPLVTYTVPVRCHRPPPVRLWVPFITLTGHTRSVDPRRKVYAFLRV